MFKHIQRVPAREALWTLVLCGGIACAAEPPEDGAFAQALRAAGWQTEVLADGGLSLKLRPIPTREPVDQSAESATEPSAVSADEPSGAVPVAPAIAGDWDALRDHGWRVLQDPDGSTLLYPPVAEVPAEPPAPTVSDTTEGTELAQDLDALLAERGWRVRTDPDGTLTLFPLSRPTAAPPVAEVDSGEAPSLPPPVEPSTGVVPSTVVDGEVSLPISKWSKVKAVAQSWLESTGDTTLRVGRKVRRVHRVYLVSIVDASPPYAVRHQIAISVEDGRVVVLN